MELISLFIHGFREQSDKALTFCNKFILDYRRMDRRVEISIQFNPSFIDNLFDYPNVKNVTAIIGQNGSGKTSILDYIKLNLSNGRGDFWGYSIQVVKVDESDAIDAFLLPYRIYYPTHWTVDLKDETKMFSLYAVPTDKEGAMVKWQRIDVYDATTFVFFSNVFDGKDEPEIEGVRNISTNYMLRKDYQRYDGNQAQVLSYNDSELLRQLLFIASDNPHKSVPFPLPNRLFVSVDVDDRLAIEGPLTEAGLHELFDAFSDTSFVYHRSPEYEDLFMSELLIAGLFNFVRHDIQFTQGKLLISDLRTIDLTAVKNLKQSIQDVILELFNNIARNPEHPYSEHGRNFLDFFGYVRYLILTDVLSIDGQLPSYPLDVVGDRRRAELFINRYVRAKGFSNFLRFEWADLSSGQKAMLAMLSRFYALADQINIPSERLRDNLIILIDEGDVYFHPEWQRKFFKTILDFLATLFHDRSIQLILTSNSPFIVSDLPKQNLIFLDKSGRALPSLNSKEQTFASNIHTLFTDSFFMEDALIGEFAKSKVDAVIDYLYGGEYTAEETHKWREILTVIGEPVLKYKIEELWINTFGDQAEIDILRSRLSELERKRRNGND